jgi:ketosteroid isomerase-like protein
MRIKEISFGPATIQRWNLFRHWMAVVMIALTFAASSALAQNATEPRVRADAPTRDNAAETENIRRLIAKYAQSVDKADTTLASQIWLNSPDVTFIDPLGHEHGFEQIKRNIYEGLMGSNFSERKLSPHDISVHGYGDSAWSEFYWDFVAKLKKDGSIITTHGRETQVYHQEPDGWRLVHVHYSGMPVAE